jgi:L-arabinokinase
MQTRIACYITAHGFGHAVRSLAVIQELREIQPGLEMIIVSDIPDILIQQNSTKAIFLRRRRLDVGLVQLDSLRFDLAATKRQLLELYRNREALVSEEANFLRSHKVSAVFCDIPFLPFVAASRVGLPAIGMGNFTWDWIYREEAFADPDWQLIVSWIRESYRHCGLFLQLPMHGDCSVIPRIMDVPMVARRARHTPHQVRTFLGVEPGQKITLISFTDLTLEPAAQDRLETIRDSLFLYRRPLQFSIANGRCVEDEALSYADLVGAADEVITKPGYGIVADCLVHGTPMIYSDRGPFPEVPILVEAMAAHLPVVFLPSEELYAGNWEPAIRQLREQPRSQPQIRGDGARVCAERILAHLE